MRSSLLQFLLLVLHRFLQMLNSGFLLLLLLLILISLGFYFRDLKNKNITNVLESSFAERIRVISRKVSSLGGTKTDLKRAAETDGPISRPHHPSECRPT